MYLTPFRSAHWGVTNTSGRPQIKKIKVTKKYLEFDCRKFYFMPQIQYPKFSKTSNYGGPLGLPGGLRLKSFIT